MVLSAIAAAHAQVIPAARAFTNSWRNAGMTRDIPAPDRIVNVKDYGARGDGTTNELSAITAAITALNNKGGVVYFPAGIYRIPNNSLNIPSNTVLRGERSFNTEICITNLVAMQDPGIKISRSQSGTFQDVVSGYQMHSTTIVVTNTTQYNLGDYVEFRQSNDTPWKLSYWASNYWVVGQYMQVTNVTSNSLSFATPFRLEYESRLRPQIRKMSPIMNVGLENLRISRITAGTSSIRDNVFSIWFWNAANCWVRGCEITNLFGAGVGVEFSANIEITGNYIHHANEFDGGGSGYGIAINYRTSEILVENNIFKRLRHSMLLQAGANGNVLGYNYSEDQYKSDGGGTVIVADMACHGNYPFANLFEGNCGAYIDVDSSHGMNGPYNTFFRNRARVTKAYIFLVGYLGGIEVNDSLCTNQTFVGNEDPAGTYDVSSPGVFEWGNNINGTIKPTGTDNVADYSYYLGTTVTSQPPVPEWWNIPGFIPVYGPTNVAPIPPVGSERNIPARVRFFGSGPKTYAPPSIWRQPTNQWVIAGDAAMFSVGATGTPYALYQWYKEDDLLEGETNDTLNITSSQLTDQGRYYALVSDSNGYMRTATALLSVHLASVELITDGAPEHYSTPLPAGYGTQVVAWATVVTNQVASPIAGPPGTQYWCTGWTGTGSVPAVGSTTTVVVNVQSNSLLTWQWADKVQFTRTNTTGGTVTGRTNGWYWLGTNIVVTNVPSFGYHFAGWSGMVPPAQTNDNPLTLTMDQARSITATFAINSYTLTVASVHGSATPPVGDYIYAHGRVLTNRMVLMETNIGSQFTCTGWVMNGNVPLGGSTTSCVMTITNTAVLTWNWQSNYYLRFTNSGQGSIDRTNGWYGAGSNLSVVATPSVGYSFGYWAGDVPAGLVSSNPLPLPVDQHRSVIAQFLLKGMMFIIRGQPE